MRILLQDFSGHPFQVQLSRVLARRGHTVLHTYAGEYITGHGRLQVEPTDPAGFAVQSIDTGRKFDKYSRVARVRFETAYARALNKTIDAAAADVTVLCNVPLFALYRSSRHLRRSGQPYVLWHQDVYSLAMSDEVTRSLPGVLSRPICQRIEGMEKRVVENASGVVAIADSFVEQYRRWKISPANVNVIPNWAPIDEITPRDRANAWSQRWSDESARLVYAGTLGRKHNPLLLIQLLGRVRDLGVDARLVVVSEGAGADVIAAASVTDPAVTVLPFQPAEALPDVLAAGDVLIALLEPDASRFSVPSKVASYLAAGRPVILLGPADNPAARDLNAAGGLIAQPNSYGVELAAKWVAELLSDEPARWSDLCVRARNYAEQRFDIEVVADRFEKLLYDVSR